MRRTNGVTFERDCGHSDDRTFGKPLFKIASTSASLHRGNVSRKPGAPDIAPANMMDDGMMPSRSQLRPVGSSWAMAS